MDQSIIAIEDLSYTYPDGSLALRHIDLQVGDGECLGLIGPNGAGKSTLLLHLNGILRGRGKVSVCGMEMAEQNLSRIRSRVGLVFQDSDHQLFMPTVYDDVAFGPINMKLPPARVDALVRKALQDVDMLDFIHRPSHHLSIGEKKRVAIATVLSMNPRVLVFDEPSANLDPKHRRDLIRFVQASSITKIVASHDLELVLETCSRVLLLEGGQVRANGLPRDILLDQALLKAHSLEVPYSLKGEVLAGQGACL